MTRIQRRTALLLAACFPAALASAAVPLPQLFVTSDQCMACHNGLVTPRGEDVSFGADWRASIMAHSARDPYWQAAVRRETIEHPSVKAAVENECTKCHMPMANFAARAAGALGEAFANLPADAQQTEHGRLAADGVSCTVCHQIRSDNFGERESFTGGFEIDTTTAPGQRVAFGPFEVAAGLRQLMRSSARFEPQQSGHVQRSELCATCHTLYTHSYGPDGQVVGELPEQVPYQEWKHSDYPGRQECQSCHMPVADEKVQISSVLGDPRSEVSRHVFRGGNFFMLRLLNANRHLLALQALLQEMDTTARRTAEHLRTSSAVVEIAALERSGGGVRARVTIENLAGHKLPSAYPSRRAWLHFTVKDRSGRTLFSSGALRPDGSIAGNDNDADGSRYEPHHDVIRTTDEVQIWEPILGDPDGAVTTGLLRATRYLKDNRLLPSGFDKATAGEDIAVAGGAMNDPDFTAGGDTVRYEVDTEGDGPLTVAAELWYQPIGFRWAHNLEAFDSAETDRFVPMYDAMAGESAILLARDTAVVD
ncbi:MAG TPA: hypothetical protein PKJ99_17740 [Thermoanaerobaculales bacterium]|nr:hypothetical protein [Thermoanaerobaculales bacterium]HQL30719.1 hypothetical protein [Thermoanaerobaculales bacterium]